MPCGVCGWRSEVLWSGLKKSGLSFVHPLVWSWALLSATLNRHKMTKILDLRQTRQGRKPQRDLKGEQGQWTCGRYTAWSSFSWSSHYQTEQAYDEPFMTSDPRIPKKGNSTPFCLHLMPTFSCAEGIGDVCACLWGYVWIFVLDFTLLTHQTGSYLLVFLLAIP